MGDMGYSGSTFFRTHDEAYLVKGVPRHFEHSFFRDDMLVPYAEYMQKEPGSLLVRITDFLECSQPSVGSVSGLAPTHHIVMENTKSGESKADGGKWESWDLKPMSYFYPERDVAGGALSSETTKSKLADDFEGSVVVTLDQAEAFKGQLEKDTALLRTCNAVDYSLFLVRMPASLSIPDSESSSMNGSAWHTGVLSADGNYHYRACILDFFWAKHKVHAKAMTGLINTYNVLDKQGPMSVTTTAEEYRERFLNMCKEILEVKG
ncbi:SAICAR synthase-like protein [Polychaeton citri CBS 116435]|uniref:SAICAR synthase-like protein n=1 Tax=Polychaeton citri CBS 116435 TaxID=1314669 RepID=A0A9P4ULL7_9PEZI|nr:SAICAR synthase-like protein [Polychaeton citri CBS 116435]